MGVSTHSGLAGPHRRWLWLRGTAGLLALFWGLLFFGIVDLLAFAQGEEFHATILLSTGWGLLFLFLVAGPLLVVSVGRRAASAAATLEMAAVAIALATTAVLSTAPRFLLAALGVGVTVIVVTVLGATSARTALRSWRWAPLPVAILAIAVVPAATYSWISARNTGTSVTTDDTLGLDHWPAQAALPIAALLIALVAAGHPRGWRLPAWSVVVCGFWFGLVALAEPDLVGSVNRWWSAALIGWSAVFIAATEYSARAHARIESGPSR